MSRQAVKGSIERSCSPCIDQGAPSKNDRPSIATACVHSDVERKTRSAGRNTSTICIEACLKRHVARTPLKEGVTARRDEHFLSEIPVLCEAQARGAHGEPQGRAVPVGNTKPANSAAHCGGTLYRRPEQDASNLLWPGHPHGPVLFASKVCHGQWPPGADAGIGSPRDILRLDDDNRARDSRAQKTHIRSPG